MTRPSRHRTTWRTLLGALLLAVVGQLLLAPAAQAANYQYWGYWQLTSGTWAFAKTGPSQATPAEGSVEGWRWAVAGDDGRPPRVTPTFDAVCGSTPAESGKKRVAVVVDFGRPADGDGSTTPPAPTAECALVASAATGAEILAATGSVRNGDAGLVCGIDDYPATGCGGEVAALSDAQKAADTPVTLGPTATPQPTSGSASTSQGILPTAIATAGTAGPVAANPGSTGSSGVPAVVWVGLVVLLLGAALLGWAAYRRRQASV